MKLSQEQQEFVDFVVRAPAGTVAVLEAPGGTGKSHAIKEGLCKALPNTIIGAYSGMAARNIGGMTVDRLFSFVFGLIYNPKWTYTEYRRMMYGKRGSAAGAFFNKQKMEVLQFAMCIVIEEAFALTCDKIDAIDMILRGVMKEPLIAFGGKKIVFVGDPGQLPPIVKDEAAYQNLCYNPPYDLTVSKVFCES